MFVLKRTYEATRRELDIALQQNQVLRDELEKEKAHSRRLVERFGKRARLKMHDFRVGGGASSYNGIG